MKRIFVCLCLCVFLPLSALAAEPEAIDKSGLKAMLEKNRGKVIILNFFATWCPPCRAELPELVRLREAYPESELVLIGLSVDEDKARVPPFARENGVNYPVYMVGRDVTDAYSVSSVPHNAFFARDGRMIISEPGMADFGILKQVVNDLASRE